MARDFSNRRGFFDPTKGKFILKKPSVAAKQAVLTNIAAAASAASVPSTTLQKTSVSADAASRLAQQISIQKELIANAPQQAAVIQQAKAAQQTGVTRQINTAQQLNTAQKLAQASVQKNAAINAGRFSRRGPVADTSRTVYGKTLSQEKAEEEAAKAASTALKSVETNSQLIGGKPQTAPEIVYFDIDSNLKAVYSEATSQGIKVAAPTVYGQSLKTEAAAKTAQQNYINYLDQQYSAFNAAAEASAPVTVYDDLGRQQAVSQSQRAQMEKAQQARKSSGTYTVLPEEVANSNANWWINSNGLYEWTPVTAGDKTHLDQINRQRKQLGQSPRTTLTCGASPSAEYTDQWYSTGGKRTQATRNTKLAALKSSSSINNSSSAKSNTAQTQKVTVISSSETAKKQAAAQAQRKVEAAQAAEAAKKAEALASQAKAEATAKAKLVTQAQAAVKKTADPVKKAELKKEVKALEKEANNAKKASEAAQANVKASTSLANATQKVAAISGTTSSTKISQVNKAINSAKAKVEKADKAAQKAGLQDHTGQILLKDGTWISQKQSKGKTGEGEASVKVFGTTKDYQKQMAKEYKDKQAGKSVSKSLNPIYEAAYKKAISENKKAAEATAKAVENYKQLKDNLNRTIDAITVNGGFGGKGERNVKYISGDFVKSAQSYRDDLSSNKKLAAKAITQHTSAAEETAILKARDVMAGYLASGDQISYLSELKQNDLYTSRATKIYDSLIDKNTGSLKYDIGSKSKFIKELAKIEKDTETMSAAEKQQYLLEKASKGLSATGKASDIWVAANTDLIDKYILKKQNPMIAKKQAGWIKSGSSTDVIDAISRKQVEGKALSATDVALLASINNGFKPSSTVSEFTKTLNNAAAQLETGLNTYSKTFEPETTLAFTHNQQVQKLASDAANALWGGFLTVPGMVSGVASGAAYAADYTLHQARTVNSASSAKQAFRSTSLGAKYAASMVGRSMGKEAETDPAKFVASLALTQAALGGIGKAIKTPTKAALKTAGVKTGVIRNKTLGSEHIPYKEAGSVLDELRYNKAVTGSHATVFKMKNGKPVHTTSPGTTSYVEPGTFGRKGLFTTISDGSTQQYGKYFINGKPKKTFATVRKIVSPVTKPVTKQLSKVTEKINRELAKPSSRKLTATDKAIEYAGKKLKENYKSNLQKFSERSARRGEKAVYNIESQTVKLPEAQWNSIYKKFSQRGNFWDEYESIIKTAEEQANRTGQHVAVPSPKVAAGVTEAEMEIWLIAPKKGLKVTSKQWTGKTENGVDVYDIRFNNQKALESISIIQRLKENRAYNRQTFRAVNGKNYNLNHLKTYANDANRRLGELYGNKLTRPGAFEQGLHGKTHTEQVGRNVTHQGVTTSAEIDYWLGVMHDVTKVGPHESAGIPHAVAAAEVIRQGLITDPRFLKFYNGLSKATQKEFVKAISQHTTIKPINRHLITEWKKSDFMNPFSSLKGRVEILKEGVKTSVKDRPSKMSKALATADRLDFVRFEKAPLKRMMWNNLKQKPSTSNKAVKSIKLKLSKATERKSATLANRVKLVEKKSKKSSTATKSPKNSGTKSQYSPMSNAEKNRRAQIRMLREMNKHRSPSSNKSLLDSAALTRLEQMEKISGNVKTQINLKMSGGMKGKTSSPEVAADSIARKGAKFSGMSQTDMRIRNLSNAIEDIKADTALKAKKMSPEEFKAAREKANRSIKELKAEINEIKWVEKTKQRARNAKLREEAKQKKAVKKEPAKSKKSSYEYERLKKPYYPKAGAYSTLVGEAVKYAGYSVKQKQSYVSYAEYSKNLKGAYNLLHSYKEVPAYNTPKSGSYKKASANYKLKVGYREVKKAAYKVPASKYKGKEYSYKPKGGTYKGDESQPYYSGGYEGQEDWPIIWSSPETGHWHPPEKVRKIPYVLGSISKGTTKGKLKTDRVKFHRNIKNTLGSLGSFFDDGTPKKAPARSKSVKISTKKRTTGKRGKK